MLIFIFVLLNFSDDANVIKSRYSQLSNLTVMISTMHVHLYYYHSTYLMPSYSFTSLTVVKARPMNLYMGRWKCIRDL